MDEVLAAVMLLLAAVEALYLGVAKEVKKRFLNVYTVLALAAGGLFVAFADAFEKAVG